MEKEAPPDIKGLTFFSWLQERKRQLMIFLPIWVRSMLTIQFLFLFLLTFQNTAAVMLMSYTQQHQPEDPSERFQVSHVVMMQEVVKLFASLLWCFIDVFLVIRSQGESSGYTELTLKEIEDDKGNSSQNTNYVADQRDQFEEGELPHAKRPPIISRETLRTFKRLLMDQLFNRSAGWMLIPAILYLFQNYFLFIALANLEPTLFQVTYQSKILGTALLMWMFLNRNFSAKQWLALVFLMFGVATAQVGSNQSFGKTTERKTLNGNYGLGLFATLSSVLLSSVASVLMEAIFKSKLGGSSIESHTSTKNVHLSFYSVLTLAFGQFISGRGAVFDAFQKHSLTDGFREYFCGFTSLVWVMVFVQALGGLLVALVIRYSDNIMKAFATGCAIVLSGICSAYVYSFAPDGIFVIGNVFCLMAIALYNC